MTQALYAHMNNKTIKKNDNTSQASLPNELLSHSTGAVQNRERPQLGLPVRHSTQSCNAAVKTRFSQMAPMKNYFLYFVGGWQDRCI
jgi:hypothetical protein